MSIPNSPDYQLEQSIASLFTTVTGVNVYTTTRTGARLFPYIAISARPIGQLVTPYSGVYNMQVAVDYSNSSAKVSFSTFDSTYLDIFACLYGTGQSLQFEIQDNSTDLKVYMARISSQTPTIEVGKRAWRRGLVISAIVTPDPTGDGGRELDFSDYLNSQYLAVI
jgi:hypothetical protein